MPATETCGFKFNPQNPFKKGWVRWHVLVIPELGRWRQGHRWCLLRFSERKKKRKSKERLSEIAVRYRMAFSVQKREPWVFLSSS